MQCNPGKRCSEKAGGVETARANARREARAIRKAKAEGMPTVLEGNPAKGMTTLFAICDYDAGFKAGDAVGRILVSRGVSEARVMDVGLPLLSATVLRSLGFMEAIAQHVDAVKVHELDGSGMIDSSVEVASAALAADSNINVIYGINDGSALGGLQAWRAAGLPEDDLIVAGTGAEGGAGNRWAYVWRIRQGAGGNPCLSRGGGRGRYCQDQRW